MLKMNKIKIIIISVFVLSAVLQAQTNSWTLEWDPNPESDMYSYQVFRGTSANPTNQIATVLHPTTIYEDNQIDVGVQYYYRIKAVNTSYQASDYSDQVSAAIPKISNLPIYLEIEAGSLSTLDLDDYVYDPDHADDQLTWGVSGNSSLQVSINSQTHVVTITAPADWDGSEQLIFTTTDPDEFYDLANMTVSSGTGQEPQPPQISSIPSITFNEDGSHTLELNDFVDDPDTQDENLYWYARGNERVVVNINHTTNSAQFSSETDWNGQESFWMVVADPDENKDSAMVTVTVQAVNDPPVFDDLPMVNLSQNKTGNVDLKNYVSDVDDPVADLTWDYTGNQNVTVSISTNGVATFSIPVTWNGTEEISLFIQDKQGAGDTAVIIVYSQDETAAPNIVNLNMVQMNEDEQSTVDLSSHVSDPNNSPSEMVWSVIKNEYINTHINSDNHEITLSPHQNWYGIDDIVLKVEDPDGNFDFDTLAVNVAAVNDIPQIKNIGEITVYSNSFYSLDLTEYIIEADGLQDLVSIELLGGATGYVGFYLDIHNYELTFFASGGFLGHETFMLKIVDTHAKEAVAVISIDVRNQNLASAIAVDYFGAETNIQLNWQTISATRDYVQYGPDRTYAFSTEKDATFIEEHIHVLNALEPETVYHFRVVSQDENGRITYSEASTFTTGSAASEIKVFPLPYRKSDPQHSQGIFFVNLPEDAEIVIFNLLGEVVFRKNEIEDRLFRWDVKNNAGNEARSGLYLYIVKDSENAKKSSGKLVIVR